MPVKTGFIERTAFRLNIAPAPVLDYIGALGLRAVGIAERIGLFELLEKDPQSESSAASALGGNPRGVAALLHALESVGYVRWRSGVFALSPMAARWIPRFRQGMGFYEWMAFEGWRELEASLLPQGVAPDPATPRGERGLPAERFGGMLGNARASAEELARRIRIPGSARRLVDIGAGHGLYAAKLCQRNPGLTATLVDDQATLEQARRVLDEEGVTARVEYKPCDFWSGDFGSAYDVGLLANVLVAVPASRKVALLSSIARHLNPSGMVIVFDQMRRDSLKGNARAIVELTNLRLFDPLQGDTYHFSELQAWFKQAGLHCQRSGTLRGMPWMSFAVARKLNP